MRIKGAVAWAALLTLTLSAGGIGAHAAQDPGADLSGTWKLSFIPLQEIELISFRVKAEGGKVEAEVGKVIPPIGQPKVGSFSREGDRVAIALTGANLIEGFAGTLVKDGPDAGKVLGTLKVNGATYPAVLARAESVELATRPATNPKLQALMAAGNVKDPKEQVAKLDAHLKANPGLSSNFVGYNEILNSADRAELSAADVKAVFDRWAAESTPYGPEWVTEVKARAAKALDGKAPYAELALELAQAADAATPADAPAARRAEVVALLARAAKLAGKDDLAAKANARSAELETKLDADYHEQVPPFKVKAFAGREGGKGNRVVVMELFTGAQCPPCVAADVAFDALLETYKPTEFIGLQYHLHIPGPDPLTNSDSQARADYYGDAVRGTPTTFFNGKSEAGGGGGMGNAEPKYAEYRELIDPFLAGTRKAAIELTATRAGDSIKVMAKANVEDAAKDKDSKLRLRLALVEPSVRYVGGNRLRFHHQVVRALPGGPDGKELAGGKAEFADSIDLAAVKKGLESYLADYPGSEKARGPFPNPLPPIELKDLAVVAFVQDDSDKSILHAVRVPVEAVNP